MERISVVGCSGSGKTTLSRALAARLGVPHLEVDALNHQAGWTPRHPDELRADLAAFVAGDRWVVDGNYVHLGVGDLVWPRADTVLWVDPPRQVVMRQVIHRTLRRVATREVLWNGNREPWTNLYSLDPERNIIAWAWTRFPEYRARYARAAGDGTWAHLDVRRLRTRAEVEALLRSAGPVGPGR